MQSSLLINLITYNTKKITKIICLLILSLSICSCGILSLSSGTTYPVSYIKGELSSKIEKDQETVWKAVQKVAEDSQFQVKSTRADAFSAVLKCEDAQQRKIEVTLENETPELTRVRIRVGLLGDAEFSGKIYEQILKKVSR